MMKSVTVCISKREILNNYPELSDDDFSDNSPIMMFKSGAKLYKGKLNGTYRISGYDQRGSDVLKAVQELYHIN